MNVIGILLGHRCDANRVVVVFPREEENFATSLQCLQPSLNSAENVFERGTVTFDLNNAGYIISYALTSVSSIRDYKYLNGGISTLFFQRTKESPVVNLKHSIHAKISFIERNECFLQ